MTGAAHIKEEDRFMPEIQPVETRLNSAANTGECYICQLKPILSEYIKFRCANKEHDLTPFEIGVAVASAIYDNISSIDIDALNSITSDFEKMADAVKRQGSSLHISNAQKHGKAIRALSPKTYTVKDIATEIGCTEENVRKDVRQGRLTPCRMHGRIQIFNEQTANDYIKQKRKRHY